MLKQLANSLNRIMRARGMTAKKLASASNISYPSLMPILNGNRDFGVTKLLAIMNALDCSSAEVLDDFLPPRKSGVNKSSLSLQPEYLISFCSLLSITYCLVCEIKSEKQKVIVLPYISLTCNQQPNEFVRQLLIYAQQIIKEHFHQDIPSKKIAVFVPVQKYELKINRLKIQKAGDILFSKFIIESDIIVNHKVFLRDDNGICVTINDNSAITYSLDKGGDLIKIQNYGFPISDVAGKIWVGCEALKYAINYVETAGRATLLSDKILAAFGGDLNCILESLTSNLHDVYFIASDVVMSLVTTDENACEIIKRSAELLLQKINLIGSGMALDLPIVLAGDLVDIYKNFMPKDRLITCEKKASDMILNYGVDSLLLNNG